MTHEVQPLIPLKKLSEERMEELLKEYLLEPQKPKTKDFDAYEEVHVNYKKKKLNILIGASYLASICTILGSLYFCNIDRADKTYPRLELFPLSLGASAGGLTFYYGRRKEDEFKALGF